MSIRRVHHRFHGLFLRLAIGCCSDIFVLLVAAPAIAQSFQGIGELQGGVNQSVVLGVSGDGQVVVGESSSESGREAFHWRDGVFTSRGEFDGGEFSSVTRAASFDGSVVVGARWTADFEQEAFLFADGAMHGLGDIEGGPFVSGANDVSADGRVVVVSATIGPESPEFDLRSEAFRWENGVMTGLGRLRGTQFSRAFGVSADGTVIVGDSFSRSGSGRSEAFRWKNGLMHGLGTLAPDGGSGAADISANGRVIVGHSSSVSRGFEAFRWKDGVMTSLGIPGGGNDFTYATAVSANGSIIVGSGESEQTSATAAYIWDAAHGARVLADVLRDDYEVTTDGWQLLEATGVSDDGKTIVGYGKNPNGDFEGWVVRVPEPPSIVLAVMLFACSAAVASLRRA